MQKANLKMLHNDLLLRLSNIQQNQERQNETASFNMREILKKFEVISIKKCFGATDIENI